MGLSVTDVLAALMRKTRAYYRQKRATLWHAVKYQEYSPVDKYDIWHVSLEVRCYEYGVSERLVFKVSVSRIYQVAIDMFLDSIVQNGTDYPVSKMDISTNYKLANYNITFLESVSYEFWLIKWDRRVKEEKLT